MPSRSSGLDLYLDFVSSIFFDGAPRPTPPHHNTTRAHADARPPLRPGVVPFDQVEKTQDLTEQTKRKAETVTARAGAHISEAKGVAQAAERQAEALRGAQALRSRVEAVVEEALGAIRWGFFFFGGGVVSG